MLLSPPLGGMRSNIDRCVQYTKERKQFGKPIAKFQAVRQMIADMKIRYEIGRNLIHRVAWQLDNTEDPPLVDAAIAKVYVSEAAQKTARDAVQIHGGNGFTVEYQMERAVRDSLLGTIGGGTSEIQRSIIARGVMDLGF